MKKINTNKAPDAVGPYAQAIKIDDTVYTSGQIALMPNGDDIKLSQNVSIQTEQVLENIKVVLEASQSDLSMVLKTTIYLISMSDFEAVNSVYAKYFNQHLPARSTVAVSELPKGAQVEIECIAKSDRLIS